MNRIIATTVLAATVVLGGAGTASAAPSGTDGRMWAKAGVVKADPDFLVRDRRSVDPDARLRGADIDGNSWTKVIDGNSWTGIVDGNSWTSTPTDTATLDGQRTYIRR